MTESDGDEIFIKLNGKKIWPQERYFSVGNSIKVKLDCCFDIRPTQQTFEFELWEYDNIFSSQCIGRFYLRPDQIGGPFTTDLKETPGNFARYSLDWGVGEKR